MKIELKRFLVYSDNGAIACTIYAESFTPVDYTLGHFYIGDVIVGSANAGNVKDSTGRTTVKSKHFKHKAPVEVIKKRA
jgi:hypothetical protein